MILIDTSVWVDHLRRPDARVASMLESDDVLMHPFVFGELAMGDLRPREQLLYFLSRLPVMLPARDREVLTLIEREKLYASGVGYIDAHLITAARLSPETRFWTRDKRLAGVAERVGIGFSE